MDKRGYVPFLTVASAMILWLSMPVHPVQAHNGKVALGVPVEGIVVDGDLSDWPEDMVRYPILIPEYGVRPKGGKDFEGTFRIGYNAQENALYVCVEVRDESTVIDTTGGAAQDTQDGCEVYVDVEHREKDSPAVQYVIRGDQRDLRGSSQVGVDWEGEGHRYEWRIDIGRMSEGQVDLHSGMVLGFDVVVCDKDEDGSFSWMTWGRGRWKSRGMGRRGDVMLDARGDVVLAGGDMGIGRIRGRMRWEGSGEGVARGKVRIRSLESEGLWVQVETDREGSYGVEMPEGGYRVEAGIGQGERQEVTVVVREGKVEEVELVVKTPRGLVVEAGSGRAVKAGVGSRQGSWLTFDVSDGLPVSLIPDILQDREGNLWFGTYGGVSRYDGVEFVTFTTEDGLASNDVRTILEDREGNLWFGTNGGGVSRYDLSAVPAQAGGKQFVNFTTEDGLANNWVSSILEDREGNLWFGTGGDWVEGGGVSRYDGKGFITFTTEDGLANNWVSSILEDREGNLWFGTNGGGVSRYDPSASSGGTGEEFVTFTTEDGLAHNVVESIVEERIERGICG